uniref:BTB/POZ domain-containing protein 9 n=1 Tax=Cacopsylla melanoneura TaxID=428564 RepID=A0A8D8SI13_9HEMI
MTEPVQETIACNSMSTHQRNMLVLFNNPEFSDTTFIIQDSKLYAWSGLVSVASPLLGAIISEHFTNCHDREITLRNIKYEESFTALLKHIYGLDIELNHMDVSVICEMVSLSETYKLTAINKDLKDYLSKMKSFSIDTAVILLNTASKYDIRDLYKQLIVFAHQNAEQLVKDDSFHNLHYNVLLELIKSDLFCCEEIDILKAVLTWHTDMDNERKNMEKRLEKKDVDKDVIQHQDLTTDPSLEKKDVHKDVIQDQDLTSDSSEFASNYCELVELPSTSERTDKFVGLVQSFSENILKSLLAQIRISQISMLSLLKELNENQEPFKNYSHILLDVNHFSQSGQPRQEYNVPNNVQHKDNVQLKDNVQHKDDEEGNGGSVTNNAEPALPSCVTKRREEAQRQQEEIQRRERARNVFLTEIFQHMQLKR